MAITVMIKYIVILVIKCNNYPLICVGVGKDKCCFGIFATFKFIDVTFSPLSSRGTEEPRWVKYFETLLVFDITLQQYHTLTSLV